MARATWNGAVLAESDDVVVVTGASSGIGQAIAIRFGEEGANVAINYPRSRRNAQQTEREVARRPWNAARRGCAGSTAERRW